jgi:hypothetical protein
VYAVVPASISEIGAGADRWITVGRVVTNGVTPNRDWVLPTDARIQSGPANVIRPPIAVEESPDSSVVCSYGQVFRHPRTVYRNAFLILEL